MTVKVLFLTQIQLVILRIAFDPDTICTDLRYCDQPMLEQTRQLPADFYTLFHSMKDSLLSQTTGTLYEKSFTSSSQASIQQVEPSKDITPQAKEIITFLQISDIHFDQYYREVTETEYIVLFCFICFSLPLQGSPTDCNLGFCCREWYNGTVRRLALLLIRLSICDVAGLCWTLWFIQL